MANMNHRLLIKSNWPIWLKIALPYSFVSNALKISKVNRIMLPVSRFDQASIIQNPSSLKLKMNNYHFVAQRHGLSAQDFKFVIKPKNKQAVKA